MAVFLSLSGIACFIVFLILHIESHGAGFYWAYGIGGAVGLFLLAWILYKIFHAFSCYLRDIIAIRKKLTEESSEIKDNPPTE